ncbi:uncharacterized protein MONOS_8796 [Monocercomonoides exilis]|uniref:uncharacterized protein n=1 Tax=Monocercomonoides exilis TaxID=2049356 RepID=UPI00355A846B|nr:hypothetical protein MONOS_8796 [Monocercomonoides exilis]
MLSEQSSSSTQMETEIKALMKLETHLNSLVEYENEVETNRAHAHIPLFLSGGKIAVSSQILLCPDEQFSFITIGNQTYVVPNPSKVSLTDAQSKAEAQQLRHTRILLTAMQTDFLEVNDFLPEFPESTPRTLEKKVKRIGSELQRLGKKSSFGKMRNVYECGIRRDGWISLPLVANHIIKEVWKSRYPMNSTKSENSLIKLSERYPDILTLDDRILELDLKRSHSDAVTIISPDKSETDKPSKKLGKRKRNEKLISVDKGDATNKRMITEADFESSKKKQQKAKQPTIDESKQTIDSSSSVEEDAKPSKAKASAKSKGKTPKQKEPKSIKAETKKKGKHAFSSSSSPTPTPSHSTKTAQDSPSSSAKSSASARSPSPSSSSSSRLSVKSALIHPPSSSELNGTLGHCIRCRAALRCPVCNAFSCSGLSLGRCGARPVFLFTGVSKEKTSEMKKIVHQLGGAVAGDGFVKHPKDLVMMRHVKCSDDSFDVILRGEEFEFGDGSSSKHSASAKQGVAHPSPATPRKGRPPLHPASSTPHSHESEAAGGDSLNFGRSRSIWDVDENTTTPFEEFSPQLEKYLPFLCTHLILGSFSRSVKLIFAISAGCWVLKPSYLTDSLKAGYFLDETDYELTAEDENELDSPEANEGAILKEVELTPGKRKTRAGRLRQSLKMPEKKARREEDPIPDKETLNIQHLWLGAMRREREKRWKYPKKIRISESVLGPHVSLTSSSSSASNKPVPSLKRTSSKTRQAALPHLSDLLVSYSNTPSDDEYLPACCSSGHTPSFIQHRPVFIGAPFSSFAFVLHTSADSGNCVHLRGIIITGGGEIISGREALRFAKETEKQYLRENAAILRKRRRMREAEEKAKSRANALDTPLATGEGDAKHVFDDFNQNDIIVDDVEDNDELLSFDAIAGEGGADDPPIIRTDDGRVVLCIVDTSCDLVTYAMSNPSQKRLSQNRSSISAIRAATSPTPSTYAPSYLSPLSSLSSSSSASASASSSSSSLMPTSSSSSSSSTAQATSAATSPLSNISVLPPAAAADMFQTDLSLLSSNTSFDSPSLQLSAIQSRSSYNQQPPSTLHRAEESASTASSDSAVASSASAAPFSFAALPAPLGSPLSPHPSQPALTQPVAPHSTQSPWTPRKLELPFPPSSSSRVGVIDRGVSLSSPLPVLSPTQSLSYVTPSPGSPAAKRQLTSQPSTPQSPDTHHHSPKSSLSSPSKFSLPPSAQSLSSFTASSSSSNSNSNSSASISYFRSPPRSRASPSSVSPSPSSPSSCYSSTRHQAVPAPAVKDEMMGALLSKGIPCISHSFLLDMLAWKEPVIIDDYVIDL